MRSSSLELSYSRSVILRFATSLQEYIFAISVLLFCSFFDTLISDQYTRKSSGIFGKFLSGICYTNLCRILWNTAWYAECRSSTQLYISLQIQAVLKEIVSVCCFYSCDLCLVSYTSTVKLIILSHCNLHEFYWNSGISYVKEDTNMDFRCTLCLNKHSPLENFNNNVTAVCNRNMCASSI
jgi:hypothetical protein